MNSAPIGVFDSGVGGISVLNDLRRLLPNEDYIYYSDAGYCPYGGRPQHEIEARAVAITELLLDRGAKIIVVACNTATIAAVEYLRATYAVPFIGMEPAIKPAIEQTRSGVVGVMATGAALAGERFHRLLAQQRADVRIITQPCPGLVEQVEAGDLEGPRTRALVEQYTRPLIEAGVDTIVLGCTHYPFLRPLIARAVGPAVALLDTGAAVARQTRRVLEREGLLAERAERGAVEWHTSGDPDQLAALIAQLAEDGRLQRQV
jgi:glutamate racemase